MKTVELRQKSDKELKDLLQESRARSVELRFNVIGGNVKDVKQMREARKQSAQIATIIGERTQQGEETQE